MLVAGLVTAVVLFLIGAPIFVAMAAGGSLIVLYHMNVNPLAIPTIMFSKLNSFVLLAIPLFVFVGQLMVRGGAMKYLLKFFNDLVGQMPGGMAAVCVLTSAGFAALSGSSAAAAASLGTLLVKPMVEHGYPKRFSMGLIVCAATLAIMIPPSASFIALGFLLDLSVARLFMAGMLPGLLTAALLLGTGAFIAWRKGYGTRQPITWQQRGASFYKALPVLFMPVIMLGGIYGGIFTPTEAAAVSIIYGVLVCTLVYRSLKWRDFADVLTESVSVTTIIFAIIAGAMVIGMVVVYTRITNTLTMAATTAGLTATGYLMAMNVAYFILGMLVETSPLLWITVPIFYPPAVALGVDPIHFSVLVTLNIEIAQVTPPVGINLFVLSGVQHEKVEEVIKGTIPFTVALLVALIAITYAPQISLWLPSVLYPR